MTTNETKGPGRQAAGRTDQDDTDALEACLSRRERAQARRRANCRRHFGRQEGGTK